MTDLRTGVLERKDREGQAAVNHLLVQAASIGRRMVRKYHTPEEKVDFAFRLTASVLDVLNTPRGPNAISMEENFASRVCLLMRRVFSKWKEEKASKADATDQLSGSDVDVDRSSDRGDPEAFLIGQQDEEAREAEEEARRAREALLGKPAVDILRLHDEEKSNVEVAKLLKLSEGAVRYHLRKHRPEAARRRKN